MNHSHPDLNPYAPPSDLELESAAEYRRWWTWAGEWAEFRFPTEPIRACRMFRRHLRFSFTIEVDGEPAPRPPCSLFGAPDIDIDGHLLHFTGNLLTGRIDLQLDGKIRLYSIFPLLRIYAPLVWAVSCGGLAVISPIIDWLFAE